MDFERIRGNILLYSLINPDIYRIPKCSFSGICMGILFAKTNSSEKHDIRAGRMSGAISGFIIQFSAARGISRNLGFCRGI